MIILPLVGPKTTRTILTQQYYTPCINLKNNKICHILLGSSVEMCAIFSYLSPQIPLLVYTGKLTSLHALVRLS